LARGHDLDLAESAYRLCLQRYPESEVADRAQYGLAWLANMRKDHVAAAEAWAQFLKNWASSPLAPSATFLLADAEYQQGRYAAAHDRYLELLKRWPKHALAEDALYYAANATLALGEWDQARDEFRQFLRLRPGSIFAQDARLRLADCLFSLGDLESAEHAYVALRDDPSDPKEAARAELGLGWVSFARKDWDKAASRFKAAAAGLPPAEAGEAWLRAGDSLFNEGAHAAAQEAYLAAVGEGFPKSVRSQAESGAAWAAYRQKDFTRAYERWAAARDLAPDDTSAAEAAYWMGWALFRQGRYPEAAAAYAAVAAQHPKSHLVPDALVQEANSFQNGGACAQALPLYQKVVEAWPQHPKAGAALHGMQICYTALGREDDAVAAARAYLKQHADSEVAPEVQYQVAEHYLNHKDYGQAEKEFDRLKTEYPGSKVDATATYWRGEARFKESKFNAAIEDWKALVAHEPGHPLAPRALFRTGLAWYRQQEYAQAESTFLQVLDSYGNTPDVAADARFNLGMTYKRMNRNDDAVAAYKAVVKDYPSSELANMARIRIGYIYEDAKDYPKAIAAYRELAASDKGKLGAEAQYLVGDCLLAVKQTGEALLAYEAVGQNFPAESGWVVTADARAAEVLESLGRDKEALARYEEIVKTSPDSNWSAAARQRSALLRTRLGLPAAPAKPLAKPSAKSKAPKSKAAKAKVKGAAKAKPRMKTTPSAVEGGAQ
jgi:tol-pal system protein YbgF